MELPCHLNLETPQESTSHWGKPFSGPGKTELKHVRNQTSSTPLLMLWPQESSHSLFSTEKNSSFSVLTQNCLLRPYWQQFGCFFLDEAHVWFELLLIPETNDQLGFLNCVTNVTVFSWFRRDTHWWRPRFASIHFSPTRRERWSQMPAMQLGRKTLSRCLLQHGRHKDQ